MKLVGPFTVKIRRGRPELLDGAGRHIVRLQWSSGYEEDDQDTMERVAAALSRDETRETTKNWDVSCERDGWNFDIQFKGKDVYPRDVAALLNKLGAMPSKRRPTKKGVRR